MNEFNRFKKEEKAVKKYKRDAHYKLSEVECCLTCNYLYQLPEEFVGCEKCEQEMYSVNNVDYLGICDNYLKRRIKNDNKC